MEFAYHDLAADPQPHLSPLHVASWHGVAPDDVHVQEDLVKGTALLDEVLAADILVIGAPMYNFAIPSQLKAWIDRLVIAGRTFRYTPNGPEGLIPAGKKVFIASTRGGAYGAETPIAFLDHQENYLKAVLGFIGLKDITVIRAEGLAAGEDAKTREPAPTSARSDGGRLTQSHEEEKPLITIRLSLAFAFGLAAAPHGFAQAVATHEPSEVHGGAYSVEPNHTQVMFTVSHMGLSNYTGTFTNASGELKLDPKDATASSLKVSVPVASVMTTSGKLNDELKSDQWLDATRFPDMTFVSSKVMPEGKDKAKVMGDLTMHGVTKPVTLQVKFVGAGVNPIDKKYTVGFEAKGELKRSDFGVKTYVPLIGDTLHLTIAGAFEQK